jgi:hypothetical protein
MEEAINWSCTTHMHGDKVRTFPVQLSLSQSSKTPCFSFYLLCFFFYKIVEQEGGTGVFLLGGVLAPVVGEVAGKGVGR